VLHVDLDDLLAWGEAGCHGVPFECCSWRTSALSAGRLTVTGVPQHVDVAPVVVMHDEVPRARRCSPLGNLKSIRCAAVSGLMRSSTRLLRTRRRGDSVS